MSKVGKLLYIPVSYGELLDKISILEIKLKKITDQAMVAHVRHELSLLHRLCQNELQFDYLKHPLYCKLKQINVELWDICEQRRHLDGLNEFGLNYINLSKREYKVNDQRAMVKKEINVASESAIFEVKSYEWFSKDE